MKKRLKTALPDAGDLLESLARVLSKKTMRHSIGAARTAAMLAKRFGADVKKAEIAGLLHDCAKNISLEEMRVLIRKFRIKISRHDRMVPAIWHGLIGEKIAKKEFYIRDRQVLAAIKTHSTGIARMGVISKIVYIADFIEPYREYRTSRELRELLRKDISLDYLVLRVLKEKVRYLKRKNLIIHPATIKLHEHMKRSNSSR